MGERAGAGLTTFGNSLFKIAGTAESSRRRREDLDFREKKFQFQKEQAEARSNRPSAFDKQLNLLSTSLASTEQQKDVEDLGLAEKQFDVAAESIKPTFTPAAGFTPAPTPEQQEGFQPVQDLFQQKQAAASRPLADRKSRLVSEMLSQKGAKLLPKVDEGDVLSNRLEILSTAGDIGLEQNDLDALASASNEELNALLADPAISNNLEVVALISQLLGV